MEVRIILMHKLLGVEREVKIKERVETPHDLTKLLERVEKLMNFWIVSRIYVDEEPEFLSSKSVF